MVWVGDLTLFQGEKGPMMMNFTSQKPQTGLIIRWLIHIVPTYPLAI
jgi:hypothetical protein